MSVDVWRDGFDGPRTGEFADFHRLLSADAVPAPDAPWQPDLCEFALSFDGYAAFGGSELVADLANAASERWHVGGDLPVDLVELRACLFFEQRRQRWLDQAPGEFPAEGSWLAYVRALAEAIRVWASQGPDPGA